MQKIYVFIILLAILFSCNFQNEDYKKSELQKHNIELFKNDLKLFTHFLEEKRALNNEVLFFPFYCMSKYVPNSDINSIYTQLDETTFLKLTDVLLTNRDRVQFLALLPHIDSINSVMSKLSSPHSLFISVSFNKIKYSDNTAIPQIICEEVDRTNDEDRKLVLQLATKADKHSILIEIIFNYNVNDNQGTKHFIFIKKEEKYKLIGIRAYGHI